MLVLTRKINERVIITTAAGERIAVMVTDIDRGKVRLAFEADAAVRIDRAEVDEERRRGEEK